MTLKYPDLFQHVFVLGFIKFNVFMAVPNYPEFKRSLQKYGLGDLFQVLSVNVSMSLDPGKYNLHNQ